VYPKSIQNLIKEFSKFPSIGPKTAARFVFYLLNSPEKETKELINSISMLSKNVKQCSFCFKYFEGEGELCEICSNRGRDKSKLCIVEKEIDLNAIERTKRYKGIYFILGGNISLKKNSEEKIRIKELIERIKDPDSFQLSNASFEEIIIATNPTTEGEATARFLKTKISPFDKKITTLGRGLPTGGELEYADEETLEEALNRRK
jgi:recombination protein RecR